MANIMSQKNVKNHVHRNGFDLSFRSAFTAKAGEILPIMCKEVLPGDKFDIDLSTFTRTRPVNTAAFTRIREYYDFYFVPTGLLWDKWENYIIQTNNPTHALSATQSPDNFTSHPYFVLRDVLNYLYLLRTGASNGTTTVYPVNEVGLGRYDSTCKLFEYLNYGDLRSIVSNSFDGDFTDSKYNFALNPFPLLGYQKIYQDYFRFSQWEKTAPYTCNLDYIFTNNDLKINVYSVYTQVKSDISSAVTKYHNTMFDLRYSSYKKDYFMGLLPSQQFGETAVATPLIGDLSGSYGFSNSAGNSPAVGMSTDWGAQGRLRGSLVSTDSSYTYQNLSLHLDNSTTAGLSVFALRQAEFLQKWKEITNSGNLDYKEQLAKHWNVVPSDYQSYRCRYLGGSASNIDISDVVNTNLYQPTSGDAFPASDIAGKGTGSNRGHVKFESKGEYGYLYCIYHCEPILDWACLGIDRMNTRVTASDYAIPEFEDLGMEPISSRRLFFGYDPSFNAWVDEDKLLGYAPRYIDYKTSLDKVYGSFRVYDKDWVAPITPAQLAARIINLSGVGSLGAISYNFFKVSPTVLDSIFERAASSTVDTDQFLVGAFFDVKAVRNLSVNGLPY